MPNVGEITGKNQGQLRSTLDAGVDAISNRGEVTFRLYNKVVLSEDGYVFWVATQRSQVFKGSLHVSSERYQDEDQTVVANLVRLTAEEEITVLNAVAPGTMWLGSWPIGNALIQVAFARRGYLYGPADLWHYDGHAVYPAMATQVVESEADIPAGPIVSNSTPIWLRSGNTGPINFGPVYPSFLVPDNIVPPYIVAHVEPSLTEPLGNFPVNPWPGREVPNSGGSPLHELSSSQQCRDVVTLTLYGFNNQRALQYLNALVEYSLTGAFGFANSPVPRDAKRTQDEIAALAEKKTIKILANYYQSAADVIARRLILSASFTIDAYFGTGAAAIPNSITTTGAGDFTPTSWAFLPGLLTSGTGMVTP